MSVYKRGETYWFKFLFQGSSFESRPRPTRRRSPARRNELVAARSSWRSTGFRGASGCRSFLSPQKNGWPVEWVSRPTHSKPGSRGQHTRSLYEHFVETLIEQFGKRLVCDIDDQDISALQRERLAEEKSARTVNFEINVLRQVLKAHGLWGVISDRVKSLRARLPSHFHCTPRRESQRQRRNDSISRRTLLQKDARTLQSHQDFCQAGRNRDPRSRRFHR